jgi:hypothetical protein
MAGNGELKYSKSLHSGKRETKGISRKEDRVKDARLIDSKQMNRNMDKAETRDSESKKPEEPKLGADEILRILREIEEKKEDVELNLHDASAELERLQTSEPRLTKALDRISSRMPAPPSPDSGEHSISEEAISSESSEDGDGDSLGEEKRKWKRKNLGEPILLLSHLKKVPPSQRKLVSRLGCAIHESNNKMERDTVLLQSRDMAHASANRFSRLMPAEIISQNKSCPQDTCHEIIREKLRSVISRRAEEVKSGVRFALEKEFASMLRKHLIAAIKYRFAFENWRANQMEQQKNAAESSLGSAMHRSSSLASAKSVGIGSETEPTSPSLGRSSRGRRGVVRSDLEERLAIATLQAIESVKTMTKIPTQSIFSVRSSRWIREYQDMNRLVSDPVTAMEQQKYIRPWNAAEKATFAEKFLLHHKDFDRIAHFLPNRTIPEIIRYYYNVQRTAEFEKTRRKIQLRKRREKAEETALQRLGDPPNHISIGPIAAKSKDRTSAGNSERENSNTSGQAKQGKSSAKKKGGKQKQREQSVNSLASEEFLYSNDLEIPTHQGKGPRAPRVRRQSLSIEMKQFIIDLNDAASGEDSETVPPEMISNDTRPEVDAVHLSPKMGRQKRQRTMPLDTKDSAREDSSRENKPVGRGRLPSIKTDGKYIEAVQIYGKDFHAIASYMNRTVEAVKKYWERHSERLELHRLVDDFKSPEDGEDSSGINEDGANVLVYSEWAQALSILRFVDSNSEVHNLNTLRAALKSIPLEESKKASSLMLPGGELGSLLASQSQCRRLQALLPGLLQSDASHPEDIIDFLRAIDAYFQIYHAEELSDKAAISNPVKAKKAGKGRGPVWSNEEKRVIIEVFKQHGKDWDKMQEAAPCKTITQIKNFYQNYKSRYFKTDDIEPNDPSSEPCRKRKAEDSSYPSPEAFAVPSTSQQAGMGVKIEEAQQLANFLNSLSNPQLQNILTTYMESYHHLQGANVSMDAPMHQMFPKMSETSIDSLLGEISMLIESSADRTKAMLQLQEISSQQDAAQGADGTMEQQDFKNAADPEIRDDEKEAEK